MILDSNLYAAVAGIKINLKCSLPTYPNLSWNVQETGNQFGLVEKPPKWRLSIYYHKSKNTRRMELKFGVATILCEYSDLTKFDKNLEGSRFIFRWFEMK